MILIILIILVLAPFETIWSQVSDPSFEEKYPDLYEEFRKRDEKIRNNPFTRFSDEQIQKSLEIISKNGPTISIRENAKILINELNEKEWSPLIYKGGMDLSLIDAKMEECQGLGIHYGKGEIKTTEKLIELKGCVDWSIDLAKIMNSIEEEQSKGVITNRLPTKNPRFQESENEKRQEIIGDNFVRAVEKLPDDTIYESTRYKCLNDRIRCLASGEGTFPCGAVLGACLILGN
ncbi:MAG: hypothetical protein KC643_11865 [Nitrospira sp.]|nr:hypothetical protein [Nitrospira sp.]